MNEHELVKEETLEIIKELDGDPTANQRALSLKLKISLGKINYLIKELVKKGFIKVENFSKNPAKAQKLYYVLTPAGIKLRVELTHKFLKKKQDEYNKLKKEWEILVNIKNR